MNVSQRLAKTIELAHSVAEILAAEVALVQEDSGCVASSIFLLEPDEERPRLQASVDDRPAGSSPFAPDAIEDLAATAVRDMAVTACSRAWGSLLAVPMVLRDRAMGAIVVERGTGQAFSAGETRALESTAAQLVGIVVNARLLEAIRRREDAARLLLGRAPDMEPAKGEVVVRGTAACPGIGVGAAAFRGVHALAPEIRDLPSRGEEAEKARLRDALVKTRNDIVKLQSAAAHEIDEEHALIFGSHLLLMNDPALLERIDGALARGASAPVAIDDALEELEEQFRAVPDPYLQERAEDIDDLRARLLSHLLETAGQAKRKDRVLVSKRIPPSLVVELKAERAQGIVTEVGGSTSHGALLARALGIPTVTGVADLLDQVRVGDEMIVDGDTGRVVLRPDAPTLEAYRERAREAERLRTEHGRYRDKPLMTADGVRTSVLANIAVASDLATARDNGAEGVGLYRTEFPFIIREQFPTRDEQVRIYSKAYDAFPEGPIHFRVLDLGGDKFLPGSSVGASRNPFHGYRGIRVLFDHPDLLRHQVQAFALAAAGRPLSILIPMVTSMEELRRTRELIAEALEALPPAEMPCRLSVGAMIEAPAAVEIAPEIAREVDYLSIGTNDLVQYSLVVDREDSRMSSPTDAYHPAILRMVRRVVAAARAADKPCGVCGEMAARPDLAAALVALGIDGLSVVPRVIPELKQAFASLRMGLLAQAMPAVLACPDAPALAARLELEIRAATVVST